MKQNLLMYLSEGSSVSSSVMCDSNMYVVVLLGSSVVIVLFSFPFNGYREMFVRNVGDWTCVTEFLCDYGNHELAA